MPHKRNPIKSEQISGLARVLRGNAQAALENVALWHERDISHSSVERVILPDSTILLDYLQQRTIALVQGMTVDAERMRANLELTHGALFSQRVLLALVEGESRPPRHDPRRRLPDRPGAGPARMGSGHPAARAARADDRAADLDLDEIFAYDHYIRYAERSSGGLRHDLASGPVTTLADLPLIASGKVREMYDLEGTPLLMVASDRISTYDVVHPTPIPDKGKVLTGLSVFWFAKTQGIVANHLLSATDGVPARRADGRWSCAGLRCCRWSAWCAATSPGPAGRTTRPPAQFRDRAARRTAQVRAAARADLHAQHQGRSRPRRDDRLRGRWSSSETAH